MKSLIIYHSKYGQTEKISHRIASGLEPNQIVAITHNINYLDQSISFDDYQLVVIGAPIYATKHSKDLVRFVKRHHEDLKNTNSAFFSVSLSAGGNEAQKDDAKRCMEQFLAQADWRPDLQTMFAGALPYLEYGWLTRFMMKWIVRRSGGDTDTSQNYEYTNWKRVDRFAAELAEICTSSPGSNKDARAGSMESAEATQQVH